MDALMRRPDLPEPARLHLHYALGKALGDQGAWQASFAHYAEGARLRRRRTPYDPAAMTALVERSRALFTPGFFAARAGQGAQAPDPIFIVGLPRPGSIWA